MIKIEIESEEIAKLINEAQRLSKQLGDVAFKLQSKFFTEIKEPISKTDKQ